MDNNIYYVLVNIECVNIMQTGARIVEDKLPKNMDEQQAVNIFNTPFQFGRIWTALALSFNAPFQLTALHNRMSLLQ